MKFGRFYNEFNKVQIRDYFSFWVFDFPIFVVRRYLFTHSIRNEYSYHIGIMGFSWRIKEGHLK